MTATPTHGFEVDFGYGRQIGLLALHSWSHRPIATEGERTGRRNETPGGNPAQAERGATLNAFP